MALTMLTLREYRVPQLLLRVAHPSRKTATAIGISEQLLVLVSDVPQGKRVAAGR